MTGGAPSGTRRKAAIGLGLWLLALVVVGVMVARDPSRRSVTPVFHLAAERWAARADLYADPRGFHYLPQFALLFAPFHALPIPVGDLLWRAVSVGLVLGGLAAFLKRLRADEPDRLFLIASVLVASHVAPSLAPAQAPWNGKVTAVHSVQQLDTQLASLGCGLRP